MWAQAQAKPIQRTLQGGPEYRRQLLGNSQGTASLVKPKHEKRQLLLSLFYYLVFDWIEEAVLLVYYYVVFDNIFRIHLNLMLGLLYCTLSLG